MSVHWGGRGPGHLSRGASAAPAAPPAPPAALFAGGVAGAWYDPSDLSTMFQDVAGTIPVSADGQAVARINDKSGNGNHLTQATLANRPLYKTTSGLAWLKFDGVDDFLAGTLAVATLGGNISKTVFAAAALDSLASQHILFHYGDALGNAAFGLAPDDGTDTITLFQYGGDLAGGAAQLGASVITGIKAANNLSIRKNGALAAGPTAVAAANIVANAITVGTLQDGVGSFPFAGPLYGLILVAGNPDPAATETWLGAKAGLTI